MRKSRIARSTAMVLIVLSGACTREERAVENGPEPGPDEVFQTLESRLLQARRVDMGFQVTSEGILEVDLRGTFSMAEGGAIDLTAQGDFGGQPVDLFLSTEGDVVRFGPIAEPSEAPVPSHLREAIVIGFMRMGILHNLARLTGNAPPDHAEGGAPEWVLVGPFTPDTVQGAPVSFAIAVSGEPVGAASLEVSPEGFPTVRRQAVQFDEGEMRVVERYESVIIDP